MEAINWGWVISAAALLWGVLQAFWTRHIQKQSAAAKDVSDLKVEVATLKLQVGNMPTREAIHTIEISMTKMHGEMAVLTEQVKPIAATVNRIDTFLLDASKGR